MKTTGSWLLALRYLGLGPGKTVSNARKSLLGAMIGIALSLVPLVCVMVVTDGMIEGISARLVELSSSHLRVSELYANEPLVSDYDALRSLAASCLGEYPGIRVTGSWPERTGTAIIVGKTGRKGGTVRAISPDWFTENPAFDRFVRVESGEARLKDERDAILGARLAGDLSLQTGDTFRLLTLREGADGRIIPRFASFTVRGTVSSGYQELDGLWIFIPLKTGLSVLPETASETFINLRTDDMHGRLEPVRSAISRSLPDGFAVHTWQELNRSQFQSFNTTRILLLFIMFLIVLVASINVSSALVMLVMERRGEIAIMKSTGIPPGIITQAFVFTGLLCGLGGVLLGIPVGILCAININGIFSVMERLLNTGALIVQSFLTTPDGASFAGIRLLDPEYYLEVIPVILDPFRLFIIVSGTLLLSALVSLLPAIRAGIEKPIETLRKY